MSFIANFALASWNSLRNVPRTRAVRRRRGIISVSVEFSCIHDSVIVGRVVSSPPRLLVNQTGTSCNRGLTIPCGFRRIRSFPNCSLLVTKVTGDSPLSNSGRVSCLLKLTRIDRYIERIPRHVAPTLSTPRKLALSAVSGRFFTEQNSHSTWLAARN